LEVEKLSEKKKGVLQQIVEAINLQTEMTSALIVEVDALIDEIKRGNDNLAQALKDFVEKGIKTRGV